jgi:hypothetical protein
MAMGNEKTRFAEWLNDFLFARPRCRKLGKDAQVVR